MTTKTEMFELVDYSDENPGYLPRMTATAYYEHKETMFLEVWELEDGRGQISLMNNHEQQDQWYYPTVTEAQNTLKMFVTISNAIGFQLDDSPEAQLAEALLSA